MKLLHQINLAFAVLLVVVLGAAAISIHYVLMDHFMAAGKQELRTMGTSMASTLKLQASLQPLQGTGTTLPTNVRVIEPRTSLEPAAQAADRSMAMPADINAYLTDAQGHNAVSLTPAGTVRLSTAEAAAIPVAGMLDATSAKARTAAAGKSGEYLVAVSEVPQGTLTLVTPVSKIKAIERELLGKLLLVLGIGGGLALALSVFMTRKLIRPLAKLRAELKKVRERQFGDVALVKAGGEIGAVARTVHELAAELDRHNRAQKQFFQNASHELKTPLMSIAGYAEGIRDGVFVGDRAEKGLDVILSESGRLTKLVMEMTLLAKLDSEEDIFAQADVDVRDIVTEAAERMNPLVSAKGLTLTTNVADGADERLTVRGDRDKLLQALLNVLSNAARHARSAIRIDVSVDGGQVSLAVSDDGQGFPEGLLPHLFHRFVKGKDGETGLGLAISRAIVERCGGRIAAANVRSGGAVVSLAFASPGARG